MDELDFTDESNYMEYAEEQMAAFDKALNDIDASDPVEINKLLLTSIGIEFSVVKPTVTGLKKSIMDATGPIREHFSLLGFHNYAKQKLGAPNKIIKTAYLLDLEKSIPSKVSLYRPRTKKGDPRFWIKDIGLIAKANEIIALIIQNNCLYCINISSLLINELPAESPITKLIRLLLARRSSIADELLSMLKALAAKESLKAVCEGDTAIGRTIETALGIKQNSSKKPDYKGIELKSSRTRTKSNASDRVVLFAQVANWKLSKLKSSREIHRDYGKPDEHGEKRLFCTVSTQTYNSHGLKFSIDFDNLHINEVGPKNSQVATWTAEKLIQRLKTKHNETFWINAKVEIRDDVEYFQLVSVLHTKSPVLSQLLPLIENGTITMDHGIRTIPKFKEHGPLFKIKKDRLNLLFPNPQHYNLLPDTSA